MSFSKCVFFATMLAVVLTAQGCETTKGAKRDAKSVSVDAYGGIKKADAWMAEHLW